MIDKINAALMSAEQAPDGVCFHRNVVLFSTGIFTFNAGGPDDNVRNTVFCLDCGCELPDGEPEPPDDLGDGEWWLMTWELER